MGGIKAEHLVDGNFVDGDLDGYCEVRSKDNRNWVKGNFTRNARDGEFKEKVFNLATN